MRLLNVNTEEITSFNEVEKPRYAILSHTWGADEVTFQQLEARIQSPDPATHPVTLKAGWRKIRGCCNIAQSNKIQWVWIDTCCIDKASSSELSEAINSMYNWYADADVCYAYLSDVPESVDVNDASSEFAKSRWFTRGWTLQELIAPSELIFFSKDWIQIGYKHEMTSQLSRITGIDEKFLINTSLKKASIAKRMSWAAKRVTTRVEDVAYSLMGIFSVNMPMIYGEGAKAFIRLQEEIIKASSDESIFAWIDPTALLGAKSGLLAQSPAQFADSGIYEPYSQPRSSIPFSMTNQGISITISVDPVSVHEPHRGNFFWAILNCPHPKLPNRSLAILLEKSTRTGNYSRVACNWLASQHPLGSEDREIRVEQNQLAERLQEPFDVYGFDIRKLPTLELGYALINLFISDKMFSLESDWMKGGPDEDEKEDEPWGIIPPFRLSGQPEEIACAILFDSPQPERVLVSIGSISIGSRGDIDLGFSAIGVPKSVSTVEEVWHRSVAQMSPSGTKLTLGHHNVCVNTTASQMSKRKHFLVDISIVAYQTWIPRVTIGSTPPVEKKAAEVKSRGVNSLNNEDTIPRTDHGEGPASKMKAENMAKESHEDGVDDIERCKRGDEKRKDHGEVGEESSHREGDETDGIGVKNKGISNTTLDMQSDVGDKKGKEEVNSAVESSGAQYKVGEFIKELSGSTTIINIAGELAWEMLREKVFDRTFEPGKPPL